MLSKVVDNTFCYNLDNENILREITVKIGLERIDTQEVTVEMLLDSGAMGLVMSFESARKQEFKKKKIKRPIYVRNVVGFFNKKGLIEHIVEVKYLLSGTQKKDRDQCNWWSEVECYFGNDIACLPQS